MGRFLYLEPVVAKIFPIHLLNCFTNTCNITVLQECILRNTVHFLNVNILGGKKEMTISNRLKRIFNNVTNGSKWTSDAHNHCLINAFSERI